MGWFFGFKLHLVFNHLNETVAVKLTPANIHDTALVEQLTSFSARHQSVSQSVSPSYSIVSPSMSPIRR